MQLSADELKMVDHLRKQHEAWRQIRWIILVCSLLVLAANLTGIGQNVALYAVVGYFLSYVVAGWKGRPETTLLLRLIEDRLNEARQ